MSDLNAFVAATSNGFSVSGTEKIDCDFQFVDSVFSTDHTHLADIYKDWGRVFLVTDSVVNGYYSAQWEAYFKHHGIMLTTFVMAGGEKNKTMKTMLSIVDAMGSFGLLRKEPVLVVGGGLCMDVTGYACASYSRSSNFIRVPTTLIGLIDASVPIKVGINHGNFRNGLGTYHASVVTFLDFNMLRTLPEAQVRNGFAELMKISSCAEKRVWDLLAANGKELISTRFGRGDGASPRMKKIADEICWRGIKVMLDKLQSPNLREISLGRVIAFGHVLSPTLELAPTVPLRHGHAINIDMAFFVTFAWNRGVLTTEQRDEYHQLSHCVGLSMDHDMFTDDVVKEGTETIFDFYQLRKTRGNKQRFAIPHPYGQCTFINDATYDELFRVLKIHKQLIKQKYGTGDGNDAYVDIGDLGMDPAVLEHKAKHMMGAIKSGAAHAMHAVVDNVGMNAPGAAMANGIAGVSAFGNVAA